MKHPDPDTARTEIKDITQKLRDILRVRLLVCDDDLDQLVMIRESVAKELENQKMDLAVVLSSTGPDFIENVKRNNLGALIIDINLGLDSGIDIAEQLTAEGLINVPMIFISSVPPSDKDMRRIKLLGGQFFEKPIKQIEWCLIIEHMKEAMNG